MHLFHGRALFCMKHKALTIVQGSTPNLVQQLIRVSVVHISISTTYQHKLRNT